MNKPTIVKISRSSANLNSNGDRHSSQGKKSPHNPSRSKILNAASALMILPPKLTRVMRSGVSTKRQQSYESKENVISINTKLKTVQNQDNFDGSTLSPTYTMNTMKT